MKATLVGECFECGEYAVAWNLALEDGRGRAECKNCGALKPKHDNPLDGVGKSALYIREKYAGFRMRVHIAEAQVHDRVKLPDWYRIDEERLVNPPTIDRIEMRCGPRRMEVKALVEWTMEPPGVGTNPLADDSPRRFSEWFGLFELEPA